MKITKNRVFRIILSTFGENRLYVFKFYFLEFLAVGIAILQVKNNKIGDIKGKDNGR